MEETNLKSEAVIGDGMEVETAEQVCETKAETEAVIQDVSSQTTETTEATEPQNDVESAEEEAELETEVEAEAKTEVVAKQKMNLPNKLTLARIILVPVMVVLFYIGAFWSSVAATVIFIIAAITDFLDGYLARKNDIVTDFGKFLDPIADKLLVVTAIILLNSCDSITNMFAVFGMSTGLMDLFLIIIVAREFAISGLRLVAANNGTVIAADKLGKIKTLTQTISIPLLMLADSMYVKINEILAFDVYYYVESQLLALNTAIEVFYYIMFAGLIIYAISTIICLISGIQYLVKNRQAFLMSK